MNEPAQNIDNGREIVRARKLTATVNEVLMAKGKNFVSEPVEELPLTYDGIQGGFMLAWFAPPVLVSPGTNVARKCETNVRSRYCPLRSWL